MKVAVCVMNSYMSIPPKTKRHEVWVEDSAKIGDSICDTVVGALRIIDFTGVTDKPVTPPPRQKTENINAESLEVGDEIHYDNEWRTVLSVYVHPQSCYQKANLSQASSTIPLSVRIGRTIKVERKTRNFVMSMALISSHEMVKALQSRLIDYQALNDAPARIEVVPTVFIDKEPAMKALKDSIKAEYSKLGEQIKKL